MNFIEARIKMTVNQFNWEFHNNEMEKKLFPIGLYPTFPANYQKCIQIFNKTLSLQLK
jgi:hypothetical protein